MNLRSRLARLDPLLRPRPGAVPATATPADRAAALAALGLTPAAGRGERLWTDRDRLRLPPPDLVAVRPPVVTAPLPEGTGPGDLLLLDTETSGLAGGTGTLPFLVGLAWWEGEELVVHQLLVAGPSGEADLLDELAASARRFRVVVTYNGRCFDLPLLRVRGVLHRRADALARLAGWDLLATARRLWGRRAPDCRQGSIEALLGLARREGDLPGAQVPAAWQAFLRHGATDRLARVLDHNRRDLAGMARLVAAAAARAARYRAPGEGGPLPWQDCWSLARLAERERDHRLAAAWVERALAALGRRRIAGRDEVLPESVPPEPLLRDAVRLLKRARPPREVAALLERIARWYPAAGWVQRELAIVWEHRLGDPRRALVHARRLDEPRRLDRLAARLARHRTRTTTGGDHVRTDP